MKTLPRLRTLLQSFSDVGPETKGYSFEIVLTFLAAVSLAAFVYFSFENQSDQFSANSAQIPEAENSNQIGQGNEYYWSTGSIR